MCPRVLSHVKYFVIEQTVLNTLFLNRQALEGARWCERMDWEDYLSMDHSSDGHLTKQVKNVLWELLLLEALQPHSWGLRSRMICQSLAQIETVGDFVFEADDNYQVVAALCLAMGSWTNHSVPVKCRCHVSNTLEHQSKHKHIHSNVLEIDRMLSLPDAIFR